MKNSFYAFEGLDKFLYSAEDGETLYSLQGEFDIPMHKLARDNMLDNEVIEGLTLIIERQNGKRFTLLPESIVDNAEELKKKNGVEVLYPFQMVYR